MADGSHALQQAVCRVAWTDPGGRIAWANAAFADGVGLAPAALRGRDITDWLRADDGGEAGPSAIEQALHATEPVHGLPVILHSSDGRVACGRLDIEPQRDATGALTGHLWLIADITAERSRQRRLQMLQRWYHAALDDPSIGFWERDLDTDEAVWDDGMRTLWDLPAGALPLDRQAFRASILPEHRPVTDAAWASAQHDGALGHGVYRIRTATGRVRWVQSNWSVVHEPGAGRIACGSVRDITSAVHTRSAMEMEREQLQLAAEIGRVGMWRQDMDTGRLQLNDVARSLFDLPGDGVVERAQLELRIHPGDARRMARAWQWLVAGRELAGDMRLRVCRRDGCVTHLLARLRVLRNSQGRAAEVVGAFIDVTEAVRAEEARLRAQAAEAQRDETAALAQSQATVLAAVGHEIRSPLNAMAVAGEQLAGCRSDAERAPWLQVLDEAVQHLRGLADDLMRSVTADAEPLDAVEAVDLLALVDSAVRWLRPLADEAGVTIAVDADSLRAVPVQGSRQRLRQVVLNLLSNAVKYNRRGGGVRLRALPPRDGMTVLAVEDNGLGMSDAQRHRLFRPFDRLGREDGDTAGFGFGLYLAQRLVHAMGGRIEVESRLGQGSCFSVWLPPAPTPTVPPAGPAAAQRRQRPPGVVTAGSTAADGAPTGRLLLVDDDDLSPLLLEAQLRGLSTLRLVGSDGTAPSLAGVVRGAGPDDGPLRLAMIDLNLGSGTGEAVLTRLREAGYDGPAIAYTGDPDPQRLQHARAAGFDEVWLKPLQRDVLAAGLARVLMPAPAEPRPARAESGEPGSRPRRTDRADSGRRPPRARRREAAADPPRGS